MRNEPVKVLRSAEQRLRGYLNRYPRFTPYDLDNKEYDLRLGYRSVYLCTLNNILAFELKNHFLVNHADMIFQPITQKRQGY